MLNSNKKQTEGVTYKKGNEIPKKDLSHFLEKSNGIEMIQEDKYNDGSLSLTVKIHYFP